MIYKISAKLILIYILVSSITYGDENKSNRIEVLVNESVITKYDIFQRVRMESILNRLEINENNYNQLLNKVIDDLIIEKLKNKKIDEYNITFDKAEFAKQKERFYSSLDYKEIELRELFDLNNVNYIYLLDFIETELKWQKLIYSLYLRVISVTDQEINNLISNNPNINEEIASEIILQKQLDIKSKKLIKDLRDEATIEYK